MKIPFSKPTLGQEELDAVARVIKSNWLAAGPETEAFEKEFASYVGVKYAIFTNSCTSALKMAWKYYKEKGYQYYFLNTPNTFCATYASAEEMGLKRSKGIEPGGIVHIATHYGGVTSEYKMIDIEDSAHRIEPNDPLIGKIRCYSFYVTKNMTTGSGGMFVTNSKEIYEKARLYWRDGLTTTTRDRANGKIDYKVQAFAGGYDGNDISAALGRVQLRKLPAFNKRRNDIVRRYNEAFEQDWQGNHLYPFFVKRKSDVDGLIKHMQSNGVSVGYHYPGTGWLGVSLPIYPLLTDKEVEYVIKKVKEYK